MKTWKNIRDEVVNLGFTKEKEYTKNQAAFIEAANEAIRTIAQQARPVLGVHIIEHDGGVKEHEMANVAAFMDLAHPAIYKDNYTYSDYSVKGRSIIVLNGAAGQYQVWYKRYPAPITEGTPDTAPIELDLIAADIVPYLMGYRIWLDDEPEKAVMYYNRADEKMVAMRAAMAESMSSPAYVTPTISALEW